MNYSVEKLLGQSEVTTQMIQYALEWAQETDILDALQRSVVTGMLWRELRQRITRAFATPLEQTYRRN